MAFPVAPERIDEAEQQLGRALPSALRQRLLRNNGGDVEVDGEGWQLFPVFDDSDRKRAGRTANHVVRESLLASTRTGFPAGALAIAADGSGNYLVVLDGRGGIFYWDHETRELTAVTVDWL